MQLKAPPQSRKMASLKDEEQAATTSNSSNNNNNNSNNINNNHSSSSSSKNNNNNNNDEDPKARRENLEARKLALEQRLSEKSWLYQQIQKQETAIINGNYEQMSINEFFAQLAQQYKHEQQFQALARENSSILRRKQSTTSRESRESQMTNSNNNNNNNRQSETLSNRSSEYDNYQPSSSSDMLVIGVAQQQAQQQPPLVKSALKKRPTPTLREKQYMRQQQQQQTSHLVMNMNYQRSQPDVISMYSANSSNVATLRQPPQVAPQQQPIIVHCDKYYLSPTHQSYNEGGFIKSSQNIKKYVSPLASPSNLSYEQQQQQRNPMLRQLDAISLAPSYVSVDMEAAAAAQQQQQYRWRSQSHIAPPLTPPQLGIVEVKSHSSDMLAGPMPPSRYPVHDEISLSSSSTTHIEKKPKPKQWLESSLDGPAVIRQMDSQPHSPAGSSNGSSNHQAGAMAAGSSKPRAKLSSQSMSVSGRHYSMSSNQRPAQNYPSASYAVNTSTKAVLSQSTSYLNAIEQTMGISVSYPLEPLDIPPFRHLPPKPSQMQQPTPPPRPPPANQNQNSSLNLNLSGSGGHGIGNALVSPPLTVATASLSPDIRIESPKNMTVVQQATFQPYKEVTKPFEMSDFYKYSTKFKQKEGGNPN